MSEDTPISTPDLKKATTQKETGYPDEDSSVSEDEIPFEPFDVNNDGSVRKTASRPSKGSWRRPEVGWDVTITVHRFRELIPKISQGAVAEGEEDSKICVKEVEPNARVELRLGDDAFTQGALDEAGAVGMELHPRLHDGIETMSINERATFIITTEGRGDKSEKDGEDSNQARCLEYEISLDGWTEEVDLSFEGDRSIVKRITRDGDGTTQPNDLGRVTVRYRLARMGLDQYPNGEEELVFDNLQSQDDAGDSTEGLKGPSEFVLDDGELGAGVIEVLKSMMKGEQCEAWLAPKYTGSACEKEAGQFWHHITLELVEVEELPPVWSNEDTRMKMSQRFKLEGNQKFSVGDYSRALRRYSKALSYADGVASDEDSEMGNSDVSSQPRSQESHGDSVDDDHCAAPEEHAGPADEGASTNPPSLPVSELLDLTVAILCNQAACHLKIGDGASALEVAERAGTLRAPSESLSGIKAAYRKGCAFEALGDWDGARCAFRSVLDIDPNNKDCSQGLGRIARREKAYREQLRKSFGGCLVSGKLQGFASEGRSVKKTPVDQDDPDKDLLGQLDMRHGAEDQWADHSDSDSDSYSDSDSLESSDGNDEHASNDVVEEDDEDIATTKGTVQGIFPGGGCPNESESAPRHGGTDGNAEAEETKKDAAPGSEPGEGGACAGTRESSISTSAKPSSDAKAKEAAMSVGDNSPTPPDIPVRSDVPGS